MNNKNMLAALAMSAALGPACLAQAQVRYSLIDLADPAGAPDTMQYVYEISSAFTAGSGFNLLYTPTRYADIQLTAPLDDSWFPSVAQPDAGLSLDGILSYVALADIDMGPLTFTVTFTSIGTGAPGAQPYEFFDGAFNIVASGQTTPVPESTFVAMLAGGLPLLGWLARRRSHRAAPPR